MNDKTFLAFGNELTKIALFKRIVKGFRGAMSEGWNGTPGNEASWFGQGRQIKPQMGRFGRAAEEITSLGGLTRGLPIGSKSMMLLGTGMMARQALRKEDPSGHQRSRAERVSGLAGNTVGGLVGSAIGNRVLPGFMGNMVGGIAGGWLGEKATTAPFAAARRLHHPAGQQQQMAPQPQMQPSPGVPR